jgi:predicted Rossmann fold nucleotide-binding protein DprA/Smf involved in DNA uptake
MVKKLQNQLKTITKSLVDLSKKAEKLSGDLAKLEAKKTAPVKKAAAKKKTAPKKKAVAKKAAAKKAPAKKTTKKAAKKSTAKKPAKKASTSGKATVLDSVFDVVKRSRKGVDIATLKKKTGLESRQLSNALYKLSKRGVIEAQARGTYVKK